MDADGGASVDTPIEEVARATGLTPRALRYFHAIGLLRPSRTSAGGRRHYDAAALLRLQHVLLLRETGLGLRDVAAVLDRQQPDEHLEALRGQRDRLLQERRGLDRRIATVNRTITALERGDAMSDLHHLDLFDGFGHNPFEEEARQSWGDDAVDSAGSRLAALPREEARQARTGFDEVRDRMVVLTAAGARPDDPDVQDVVRTLHGTLALFWGTVEPEAFSGLAETYVADERYWSTMGGGDREVVTLLRDAMLGYVDQRPGAG